MWRLSHALVWLLAFGVAGCTDGPSREGVSPTPLATAPPPVPRTREGFLAELVPLPVSTLVVTYDVQGPGGLQGTMEVLARPGGRRRHNWRIQLDTPGASPLEFEGSTIVNPDAEWIDAGDEAPLSRPRLLGPLADAYVAASPQIQELVIAQVRRWHATLAKGRSRHRGAKDVVQGIECLDTRVATRRVCIWEEADLALRHEGGGFVIEARHISSDAELSPSAFDGPPPSESLAQEAGQIFEALKDGDLRALATVAGSTATWPVVGDADSQLGIW